MLLLKNKKIIIIILILIIMGFIFYKETKVIGTIWGAEYNFAEIEGAKYTTHFDEGKVGRYLGKVKVKDRETLLSVYTIKGKKDKESLIIEWVEGEPYVYTKDKK